MKFWSDEVRSFLEWWDRRDLIDKGDDLAERVAALVLTAIGRLNQHAEKGHLYDGTGGSNLLGHDSNSLTRIEEYIEESIKPEIKVLEKLLDVFEDLEKPKEQPLFVYGSLRNGAEEHWKMHGTKFVGPVLTAPEYRIFETTNIKALALGGQESVAGELYLVGPEKLVELDNWELALYSRQLIKLSNGDAAFAYVLIGMAD
jgi:gamma-glutamylcyclotransferase (GGCT)/AIG2-like uncharacterized protein YtfP